MRALVLAIAAALVALAVAAGAEERIAVIVHPERRDEVSLDALARIFLRRQRFWDDGAVIVPLNLVAGTPLRDAFTRRVLQQSEARLADYWNRQYVYGVLPPATLGSTEGVRRYVAAERNAIGYVRAADVDASVRVVRVLE